MAGRARIKRLEALAKSVVETDSTSMDLLFVSVVMPSGELIRYNPDPGEYRHWHPDQKLNEPAPTALPSDVRFRTSIGSCRRIDCPWHGTSNTFLASAARD
jgi:hypothetical protein